MNINIKKQAKLFVAKVQKHSPEILIVTGVIGAVTSAVMACKATLKARDIIDDHKDKIEMVHDNEQTEEELKKSLTAVYTNTSFKLIRVYAPSVILGALSLTSIISSNNILRKRNLSLAAAYATLDASFKEYRQRAVERFGEDVDKELRYGYETKTIEEKTTDENGNEVTEMKSIKELKNNNVSGYARFFEEYVVDQKGNWVKNPHWDPDNEYNVMYIKSVESWANARLEADGILFLNRVYEELGLPMSKAGQAVGWVKTGEGDDYVDFGLYDKDGKYSNYIYNKEECILLDFNVVDIQNNL